jgi:hypothetical protein
MPQLDELLAKLLSSELLTEETKTEVETEFKTLIETEIVAARAQAEVEVRAELTEQFVAEREALVEAVDTKVEEFLKAELAELHESIDSFRDLEVESAEKLVEARKELAEGVKADMVQLIDNLDVFLEDRLTAELGELKESIEEVKKIQTGRRIFEAVADEVKALMADDGTAAALAEAKAELETTRKTLSESVTALEKAKRDTKMAEVLEPLSGRTREVMEAILKNMPTEKLEEGYATYIPRVLHDSSTKVEEVSEKEGDKSSVLAEGDTSAGEKTTVVTGDTPNATEVVTESATPVANASLDRLRKLSGM